MKAIFVGSGAIAKAHFDAFKFLVEELEPTWISRSRPNHASESHPWNSTLAGAFESEASRYEFAVVANPATHHLDSLRLLLDKGIPVLLEKPLAESGEAIELNPWISELSDESVIQLGYDLRFHPAFIEMKRQIDAGSIGDIHSIQISCGQHLADWRPHIDYRDSVSAQKCLGGGVLNELSHELDMLQWLGGDVDSISARTSSGNLEGLDVEDTADLFVCLQSGGTALIHLDFLDHPGGRSYKFSGSEGGISWESREAVVVTISSHRNASHEVIKLPETGSMTETSFRNQADAFLKSIDSKNSKGCSVSEAIKITRYIEAAKKSAEMNGSPVVIR